jgi:hypothetical protein
MGITVEETINMEPSVQKVRQAVVQFVSDYYRRSVNTRVPSLREICRGENVVKACGRACYPKKLEPVFPPELDGSGPLMKRVCKASHVPTPTARISKARKATKAKAKKRSKKKTAKLDGLELAVTEVQETAHQPASREDIQRSIEIQNEQERFREEAAKEDAERLKILSRDPNPKVSGPVKDALGELMPEIMEHMFGIKVTVPELVAMQKTCDEATEQGWHVEDVYEWAALSEEEQKAFRELREKAYDKGLSVTGYMSTLMQNLEDLKAKSQQLSRENERLSRIVDGLKLEEKSLNERCSRLNTWLEEDYHRKKKGLEEKYLRDIDGCRVEFLKFKEKMEAMMEELQNDCKAWEAKRNKLIAECGLLEKQATNMVREAKESLDKIRGETAEAVKERDTVRGELRQLRALVGPKGTVADLAKQKEDLKAQLAERDRQLAEKAMQVAGEWLNQEEAIQEAEGVHRFVLDEVERRINAAGPALYVLEFLESELPDEKFRELTFAITLAQVKRESQNPDNPYFADLPLKKGKLSGAFPDSIEEYKRLHNEKMERLEGQRGIVLNQIRRDAMGFGISTHTIFGFLDEVMKPLAEAYFNPKKTRQTTPANNDRREPDRSS